MALAYTIRGEGQAVLWLHGLALDSMLWDGFVNAFPTGYQHILIDEPGFGKSSNTASPDSIDAIARQVKEILDEVGISKVSVVGHSMGGYIALALIELYPGLVSRLCLFHSQPFADDEAKKTDRKKLMAFINKNGTEPWMREFYPGLFAEINRTRLAATIKLLIDKGIQYNQKDVINTITAIMNRPDRTRVLERFEGPVLFIVGKLDTAIAEKNSRAQLDIPDVSFVEMLDDVAHMGIFEAPAETKNAIEELLNYPID